MARFFLWFDSGKPRGLHQPDGFVVIERKEIETTVFYVLF
jgi:hypothetical protein